MDRRFAWLNKLPFAPVVGAMFGLVAFILMMNVPGWHFNQWAVASGLSSIFSPARPPLGDTARLLLALLAGGITAVGVGGALALYERLSKGRGRIGAAKARGIRIEPVQTGSSHRAPIFAEKELGAPFMSDEAMDVARSELILDQPAEDAVPALETGDAVVVAKAEEPQPVEEAEALYAVSEPVEIHASPVPVAPSEPAPRVVVANDANSIAGLMGRLETALVRRQSRNLSNNPMPAGDIASLRKALGVGR